MNIVSKNWIIHPVFFIVKNFSALKCKSIVFLCIQYTKSNISKSMNWKYMVALTFVLRRVLEQIGYIPLWNIKDRQNLILWLVGAYPYLNM